jgi:hypothetical protein
VIVNPSRLLGRTTAMAARSGLDIAIGRSSKVAIDLRIPEVFGFDENLTPLIRVDQLWATIHAPRLFAYQPGGQYATGVVGVPAVPSYVMGSPWDSTDEIVIMHYGYADPKDQLLKHMRYSGRGGHSSAHVESIIDDKVLEEWDGDFVEEMYHGDS